MVQRQRAILEFFEDCMEDYDVVKGTGFFKEVHAVEKSVRVGNEVVTRWERLGACWAVGEDEWGDYTSNLVCFPEQGELSLKNRPCPLASLGAFARHCEHSFEEHGMSFRR